MNPARGADGTSTIFAGKKDDQWSIYRNTDPIEKDIPYNNTDISQDYFFFDPTNPHSYLFIKKDIISGKYLLLKNGKTLP